MREKKYLGCPLCTRGSQVVSPQVVFLQEYKGGGGGGCREYKQGTVES